MATQTFAAGRRPFSAAEYYAMAKAGVLRPADGVELRDGDIFVKHTGARRRFNVDEYYALAAAGILDPDERVELWDGEIITKAAMGSPHAACITSFEELLHEALGRRATLRGQCPVRLSDGYEPEPDYMALRRRADAYAAAHPGPEDVLLLIEVGDATIRTDRRSKLPIYALFGIPEVWLADLTARRVEMHDRPTAIGYSRMRIAGIDDSLTPAAFPDVAIPVREIMPR